jgi:hypothetical protein
LASGKSGKKRLCRHAEDRVFLAKPGIARYQVARVFRPVLNASPKSFSNETGAVSRQKTRQNEDSGSPQ